MSPARMLCALLLLCLGTPSQAHAGFLTIPGHTGDGVVDVNGLVQDLDFPTLRAGVGGNDVRGLAPVFLFALPTLPSADALTGAELSIHYFGFSTGSPGIFVNPEFSIDLFGIGARATPTLLSSDYHDGDASLSSDTLLAEGFITPLTATGDLTASGSGLLNFVRSLYQPDGTPVSPYAVFRTNPDAELPPNSGRYRGYDLASADNTQNGGAFVPQLRLAVVPEPSSLVLLCGGGLGVLGWRVRKRLRTLQARPSDG